MAGKRTLTDELLAGVVASVAAGASISHAAALAGVAHSTLLRRLDSDPELQRRVSRARRAASRRALRAPQHANRQQAVGTTIRPAPAGAGEPAGTRGHPTRHPHPPPPKPAAPPPPPRPR